MKIFEEMRLLRQETINSIVKLIRILIPRIFKLRQYAGI